LRPQAAGATTQAESSRGWLEERNFAKGAWMNFDALLENALRRSHRTTERKQDRSKRTEQQILNAALRVFARDGVSRSRIADIAAEAGISTPTLYEYFASKEALAYEVPMAHLSLFYAEFAEAVASVKSATDRISLYLTMTADFARCHPEWGRLFYLEIWPSVMVSGTDVSRSIDDFARIMVFLVRQAVEEGDLPGGHDPYETAAILMGAVNQVITTWLLYRRPKNLTKAGAAIAARTLAMLRSEGASNGKAK
jgi:AcrR family transcriptional regulator